MTRRGLITGGLTGRLTGGLGRGCLRARFCSFGHRIEQDPQLNGVPATDTPLEPARQQGDGSHPRQQHER